MAAPDIVGSGGRTMSHMRHLGLGLMLLLAASSPAQEPPQQETAKQAPPAGAEDNAAIFAFYGEWSQALATRGAEGYASFFTEDGAVLPPGAPPVEGREAIRQWMQTMLDTYATEDGKLLPGPLRAANGWAVWRFTLTGKRVPKKGGEAVPFHSKYLDVLRQQPDGSWKFVYRMWNDNGG
jgi:uncharacterized protein (TIGR02246 family)